MNRRWFLRHALAAVPVLVAGEELLELLAPKRTIFLPPRKPQITFPAPTADWGKVIGFGYPVKGYDISMVWKELENPAFTPVHVPLCTQLEHFFSKHIRDADGKVYKLQVMRRG